MISSGPRQQRGGDRQALLHAVRVDPHQIAGAVAQVDAVEHLVDAGRRRAARQVGQHA
jgi:hypothetical protein